MTEVEDDLFVSCLSGTALPGYFQFQARPERPLRQESQMFGVMEKDVIAGGASNDIFLYSLNILGISLAYHYKKRYETNPVVLDQVYPRDMPEDYIYNEYSLYIPGIYMVYTWYIQ